MTGTDTTELLSAYLDGELSREERDRVEAALEEDAALREELEALRALVRELGELPEIPAPEGFLAGVMARVQAPAAAEPEGYDPLVADGFEAEKRRIAAVEAAAEPVDESAPARPSNVVRLSWWIKGPAITALAAALVVGVGTVALRDQAPSEPPAAVAEAGKHFNDQGAPLPTGDFAEGEPESDAVADAELPPTGTPVGLEAPSPEVAVGFAGPPATRSAPAPGRRSGLREVSAERARQAEPPGGIYMGYSDEEDQPLAGSEPSLEPLPEAEEREAAELDAVAAADADEEGTLSLEEVSFGIAGSAPAAKPAESAGVEAAAGPTEGSLLMTGADAMLRLEATLRGRGWFVRYLAPKTRAEAFAGDYRAQTVEIVALQAEVPALRGELVRLGTLALPGTLPPGDDGRVRIRLTVSRAGE